MLRFFLSLTIIYVISATPLDDYVNQPDDHYKFELLKTYEMTGYKLYILNLTSQKWLDETIVANPIWWHFLCVTIPDKIVRPDAGLLLIDGGNNNPNNIPEPTDNFVQLSSVFAVATGSVAADLQQIPNQPTVFKKDPKQKRRTEDAVIAWTWKTFIDNPDDPSILLRLPMTKAAVKAMDAVTEFTRSQNGNELSKFMVVGASKRGWTTWTTTAVDDRVFAAVPIVMDMLNLNQNFHSHYRSLGGWTFAFKDYYELNITNKVDSYGLAAMQRIIDPSYYYDRYVNKKILAIVTSGDEFFLGDDTHVYWNDLQAATKGTAMLRRLVNAEHSCAGHEISIFFTLRSFFLSAYEVENLIN
ncbi:unnamed protein product [Brachionus calyciflorus]|uniref:Autocrine proliferation repressor A-like n=1 Tax=Brachionus calyciflorus TaxID=104777 RepID=A0A814PEX7_9BILA|nr:unnamed protein product [Brachionus calyciflorus]